MKEYDNSELCLPCGKCCKSWWMFTDLKDDAIRASWLDTDLITVKKLKEGLWKIMFHIPCSKLKIIDDEHYCCVHTGMRPDYCKEYPLNFLEEDVPEEMLENEKQFCPALREEWKKKK